MTNRSISMSMYVAVPALLLAASAIEAADLAAWTPQPADWKGAKIVENAATLTADKWSYLVAPDEHADVELSASVTIESPAKRFQFFGQSWSAWPDKTFDDGGFEVALLLRSGSVTTDVDGQQLTDLVGYRVQLSHKYQVLALVKFPEGGYVQVVPCEVKLNQPHKLSASVAGSEIIVHLDGKEGIRWHDSFLPLAKGRFGVGVSSQAQITIGDVAVKPLPATPAPVPSHGSRIRYQTG